MILDLMSNIGFDVLCLAGFITFPDADDLLLSRSQNTSTWSNLEKRMWSTSGRCPSA